MPRKTKVGVLYHIVWNHPEMFDLWGYALEELLVSQNGSCHLPMIVL